jgi:DNA (cytosine-5)-methyltransferase 1
MRVIDLFSGAGGLSLGLKRAGYEVAACVEINRDAMETYSGHEPGAVHYNEDVRAISFERFRGSVNAVAGGPPCQPFSIGGLRRASRDSRDMIPEFIRCLKEVQPDAFIMENVPGLLLKRTRPYFDSVLARLSECGYRLNWAVLNAADYGVPQKRRRLFVLGSRGDQLRFPAPTHGSSAGAPHGSALDVLGDSAIGEAPKCPVKYARNPDLRPSPYAGHVYNGGGRPLDPAGPCHTILASSGGYKTHWIDTLGVAPEYHAHLMAGGDPREGEVPGARRLSVEECAVIQTFPRGLVFSGRRSSQYTQVGDAVPPDLAFMVGSSVFFQLNGGVAELHPATASPRIGSIQYELAL